MLRLSALGSASVRESALALVLAAASAWQWA